MNALERMVDLLVAILLLFLLPVFYYGSGKRVSEAVLVGQVGENFLRRVSTAGEITLPVWMELEEALTRYGCDTFTLQRERRLYEPTGEHGKVEERCYTVEKQEIVEQMTGEGRSRLQAGDRLWLTVYVNDIPTVYFGYVRTGGTDA